MDAINDLLTNGYFKTARGRSPAPPPSRYVFRCCEPPKRVVADVCVRRAHSPPRDTSYTTSYLSADTPYKSSYSHTPARSRSRVRPSRPPPPPSVEDEVVSLAKEQHGEIPSYDPPAKGKMEQRPLILEAELSDGEAARLHEAELHPPKLDERAREKKLEAYLRKHDTNSSSDSETAQRRQRKRDSGKGFDSKSNGKDDSSSSRDTPPLERRRSRRDKPIRFQEDLLQPQVSRKERRPSHNELPPLETKGKREIPPQYRRSASAYPTGPKVDAPTMGNRQSGEYFLSPEAIRPSVDAYFPSSAPKYSTNDFGGRATQHEKRSSGSRPNSRPTTPTSEKSYGGTYNSKPSSRPSSRDKHERFGGMTPLTSTAEKRLSGNYENARPPSRRGSYERRERPDLGMTKPERRQSGNLEAPRPPSRRNSGEKLERPEKLTRSQQLAEEAGKRSGSGRPPLPERKSTTHSSRSSRYYGSSEDDLSDSDSDRRKRHGKRADTLHPTDPRHLRSSSKSSNSQTSLKPGSRLTSPLPSPRVSPSQLPIDEPVRSGTFPLARPGGSRPPSYHGYPPDQKLNVFDAPPVTTVRPHSRQSSQPSFPIPIPMPIPMSFDMLNHGPPPLDDLRRSPAVPIPAAPMQAQLPAQEKPLWQPPKFQPPQHLEKPVGSYRRYSEDINRGDVVPLPSCPRKSYVRGKNDWFTLPQCPGFDICPSCYNSTMAGTKFQNMFIPSPVRSATTEVMCDFGSSPWYRIAWLLTLKERLRDLSLFYGLARVANTTQPCLGSKETHRQWYSIIDPKLRTPIRNFDVCYSCVKSIEVLLPAIKGVFIPTDVHLISSTRRVCDLRFDSKRFVQYFDALETTADESYREDLPPDIRALAALVRRFSLIEECQGEKDLRDARWHIITQLPEFTVCPECFDDVVWPQLEKRKAIPLMFKESSQRIPKASCQLYSARMRKAFKDAVDDDDYKLLASTVRERRVMEGKYKIEKEELRKALARDVGSRRLEAALERCEDDWKDVE